MARQGSAEREGCWAAAGGKRGTAHSGAGPSSGICTPGQQLVGHLSQRGACKGISLTGLLPPKRRQQQQ